MKAVSHQITDYSQDQILADYQAYVRTLGPFAQRDRGLALIAFFGRNPELVEWMRQPTPARIAEVKRTKIGSFLDWCLVEAHMRGDLAFLLLRRNGSLYVDWAKRWPDDVERAREVARELTWTDSWANRVSMEALGLMFMWSGKRLSEIVDDDFRRLFEELHAAPEIGEGVRMKVRSRMFGLHQVCYQLGSCEHPPRAHNRRKRTLEERCEAIPQPGLRSLMLRYLELVSTTLRPGTVVMKFESLAAFAEFLAEHHPKVKKLSDLEREAHIEPFLIWNKNRPFRGNKKYLGQTVAPVTAHRTVTDMRVFFDDLRIWGWVDRPKRQLLFETDLGKKTDPLPRALPPDVDRDLMAEIRRLDDVFARCALVILRGTGMRIGELLDLELDCLLDFPSHGTWVKVPLGKLGTERTVPLDEETLAAFDEWISIRGRQRSLPHPRDGRMADFLFMQRGRRLATCRIHKGIRKAAAGAGLVRPSGEVIKFKPHQMRHTYGTTLLNAGMSLEALMALLGHVTPQMTLRYASLAAPTIRVAYEEAMNKVRVRQRLPLIVPMGPGAVPDRVEWLRTEMLKTRVAHGFCSRHLSAEACPYANICEQCDNYVSAPEFLPNLEDQLEDVRELRQDAEARGWDSEVARHSRVIAKIEGGSRSETKGTRLRVKSRNFIAPR